MTKSVSAEPSWLVGIDLGTTHTVVACSRLAATSESPQIATFPIDQCIQPGQVASLELLPSVRYEASASELSHADIALPWSSHPTRDLPGSTVVGQLARLMGSRTPGRLVASAKSWLSNVKVDRSAPILPWGAPEGVPKVSPTEASASYLQHVHDAWDYHHPDAPLAQQEIILTVPASFDEAARALTLEAARIAGLSQVKLLEEPQAVCYDWLWQNRHALKAQLQGIRLIWVVDIGGGTTDLTLIQVNPETDPPRLTRIAVGNHLILGGDNIDLALAHLVEQRLGDDSRRLSSAEMSQLVEQCRIVKEAALSGEAPPVLTVTLLGTGSQLVAAKRSVELTRTEVLDLVMDGFFPFVAINDRPEKKRSGVQELGLSYVADPAMTKHLAAFLGEHKDVAREALRNDMAIPIPDALLLNGGIFGSPLIVDRLIKQVSQWGEHPPKLLQNDRPDRAVAHGAVAYGLARQQNTSIQRIGGGAARSYFLKVDNTNARADSPLQGICILPRGTEEGREVVITGRDFILSLGVPVAFTILTANDDFKPEPGALADLDKEHFQTLPPLAVALKADAHDSQLQETVHVVAQLSEIGTLELQCVAVNDPAKRWKMEFQLRGSPKPVNLIDSCPHPRLSSALDLIEQAFGKKSKDADPKGIKALRNSLEKTLGPRSEWDTRLLRELAGALLQGMSRRRRSADHERIWLGLTGYCMRPGFGYPLDDWRVEQIVGIYPLGLQFGNEVRNWSEWWTLWRRIAGGLNQADQVRICQEIEPFIDPEASKRGNLPTLAKKRSYEDMVRLIAVLEHIEAIDKARIGGWLLQRLEKSAEPAVSWWALGRIGGRVPSYGNHHNLVPRATVENWLGEILQRDFRRDLHAAFAATLLGRMSGDRERDISPDLRQKIITALREAKCPDSWIAMVAECQVLNDTDEQRLFGEALPPGLKLIS